MTADTGLSQIWLEIGAPQAMVGLSSKPQRFFESKPVQGLLSLGRCPIRLQRTLAGGCSQGRCVLCAGALVMSHASPKHASRRWFPQAENRSEIRRVETLQRRFFTCRLFWHFSDFSGFSSFRLFGCYCTFGTFRVLRPFVFRCSIRVLGPKVLSCFRPSLGFVLQIPEEALSRF